MKRQHALNLEFENENKYLTYFDGGWYNKDRTKNKERERKMRKFYTWQNKDVWENAQKVGALSASKEAVSNSSVSAYEWMVREMQHKIGFRGDKYPIWLWTNLKDAHDETQNAILLGQNVVLLEATLSEDDVVLSDRLGWTVVLQGEYLAMNEEEEEQVSRGDSKLNNSETWRRIFDLKRMQQSELWGGDQQYIQATSFDIPIEQLRVVD